MAKLTQTPKRQKNYTPEEHFVLCSLFISVSTDVSVDVDQTDMQLWVAVETHTDVGSSGNAFVFGNTF